MIHLQYHIQFIRFFRLLQKFSAQGMYAKSGQTSNIQVQPDAVTSAGSEYNLRRTKIGYKRKNVNLDLERNVKFQKRPNVTTTASHGLNYIQQQPETSNKATEMKSNRSMIQSVSTYHY